MGRSVQDGTIRKLLRSESGLFEQHLLRLDTEARARRFAHHVSDDFVVRYARKAADIDAVTYVYVVDGHVRAAAELKRAAFIGAGTAEAAFSVEGEYGNQGIATKLMAQVLRSARNRGVRHLILNCLPENAKMRAIAAKYGAELHLEEGALVGDIVPASPDYASIAAEIVDDRLAYAHALIDMQLRFQHRA